MYIYSKLLYILNSKEGKRMLDCLVYRASRNIHEVEFCIVECHLICQVRRQPFKRTKMIVTCQDVSEQLEAFILFINRIWYCKCISTLLYVLDLKIDFFRSKACIGNAIYKELASSVPIHRNR